MPGIHILCKKNLRKDQLALSMDELKHEDDYLVKQLFEDDGIVVTFSGYQAYPVQHFEDEDVFGFIEGMIYNKTDAEIKDLLLNISRGYQQVGDCDSRIAMFIDDADGDYVIGLYFKRLGELIVFNDRWGRLPSWYFNDDDGIFALSREINFLLHHIPAIRFSREALAEFLVFEYTLGNKGLIKDIYRVIPSSRFNVKISSEVLSVKVDPLHNVNFEQSPQTTSRQEAIDTCKNLFISAIESRVTKAKERQYKIIADVSGGFDSRVVVAGLCELNVEADYYTDVLATGDETNWAKQVTSLWDKELKVIAMSHPMDHSKMAEVIYMTGCTVNGWTALTCYYDSLEKKKHVNDASVKFEGFGGEFIRHPYKPIRFYRTIPEMLKDGLFIRRLSVKHACSILRLDERAFLGGVEDYLNSYSESNMSDRLKHFYFEYYNNLVNAGENRERLHFWTVQPLWAKNLFAFEMKRIPLRYIDYLFYIDFMNAVAPRLSKAPIYGSDLKLDSRAGLILWHLKEKIKAILTDNIYVHKLKKYTPRLRKRIRSVVFNKGQPTEEHKKRIEIIRQMRVESNRFSSYLDEGSICNFLQEDHRLGNAYQLMTLMLYFREVNKRFGDKLIIH